MKHTEKIEFLTETIQEFQKKASALIVESFRDFLSGCTNGSLDLSDFFDTSYEDYLPCRDIWTRHGNVEGRVFRYYLDDDKVFASARDGECNCLENTDLQYCTFDELKEFFDVLQSLPLLESQNKIMIINDGKTSRTFIINKTKRP